jgi:hypothetical protein
LLLCHTMQDMHMQAHRALQTNSRELLRHLPNTLKNSLHTKQRPQQAFKMVQASCCLCPCRPHAIQKLIQRVRSSRYTAQQASAHPGSLTSSPPPHHPALLPPPSVLLFVFSGYCRAVNKPLIDTQQHSCSPHQVQATLSRYAFSRARIHN